MATHSSILGWKIPHMEKHGRLQSMGSQRVGHNWETSLSVVAAAAKSLQSCLTLCDPINGSPPGSPVPGILQARTLKWKVKGKSLSRIRLLATPWTAAYQAPSFTGFSRQEYWSGVPLPSPRLFLHSIKYTSNIQTFGLGFFFPFSTFYLDAWYYLDVTLNLKTTSCIYISCIFKDVNVPNFNDI